MTPVLRSDALAEGKVAAVTVDGAEIAIARVLGQVYAVTGLCPHRGGLLGEGDLAEHHLYCPLHGWSFDVRTGEGFFPKGARIATYAVEEREGQIWLNPTPRAPPIDFVPPVP